MVEEDKRGFQKKEQEGEAWLGMSIRMSVLFFIRMYHRPMQCRQDDGGLVTKSMMAVR